MRIVVTAVGLAWWGTLLACPFCGTVEEPLAARRDAADWVAVAEPDGAAVRDAAGLVAQPFRLLAPLRGTPPTDPPTARVAGEIVGTALVFATAGRITALAADERLIAHVATAPDASRSVAERLAWFATRLEDVDEAIAADAFAEFGQAPFAAVREAAGGFDADRLARWIADPAVDPRRRGFYGLALGMVAARSPPPAAAAAEAALTAAITTDSSDLRAGYDGLLAGLLVAGGPRGLATLVDHGLAEADTRAGDARHMLAALRFAWESLADTLPRERVAAATARLAGNPAVAADAVIDLARYEAWDDLPRVVAAWERFGGDDPLVRRAVAGYLLASPRPAAARERERLEAEMPAAWRAARAAAALPVAPRDAP